MDTINEQQHIKRIIHMEARINACRRCSSSRRCLRQPALGKGDLTPEVLLVFMSARHSENRNYMEIRQMLGKELATEKIYHTYMARCQPQACVHIDDLEDMLVRETAFFESSCPFPGAVCQGVPIVPAGIQITACLPYLMEEIDILAPQTIILFGERTAEFGLKALGILEKPNIPGFYLKSGRCIYTTEKENLFTIEDARKLAAFTNREAELA